MNKILSDKILSLFQEDNYTIPSLCEKLGFKNELEILQIIGILETDNEIILKGFKTIYIEDGGCIHLAVYGRVEYG